jgi:hypothetical protein
MLNFGSLAALLDHLLLKRFECRKFIVSEVRMSPLTPLTSAIVPSSKDGKE